MSKSKLIKPSKGIQKPTSQNYVTLVLPEDETGDPVGSLRFPFPGILSKDGADALGYIIIPLVMAFYHLIIQSIEREDFNPLGSGLIDLSLRVNHGIPTLKEFLEKVIQLIGDNIKESQNELYTMGLNDAGKILIEAYNNIYEPFEKSKLKVEPLKGDKREPTN